jgi:osmoprotectant transport system ATP-binding protein
MIQLLNISKSFSGKSAVFNLSLNIEKGKTFALIGPSGCGKSTLIRMIIGLIQPNQGTIRINGVEPSEENILEIRQNVGYVIQQGGLFPHLSAKQNCSLVANHLNWSSSQIEERLRFLCDLTKIEFSDLRKYPGEFSGGQRQRIGLIRALMLNPEILLLDEPLGSIDPLVRFELQEDLKGIFESLGKTVLLVTHDLGEAGYLGDEIVLMNKGEIIQKGSIKEITQNPADGFVKRFVSAQRNHLEEVDR